MIKVFVSLKRSINFVISYAALLSNYFIICLFEKKSQGYYVGKINAIYVNYCTKILLKQLVLVTFMIIIKQHFGIILITT